MYEFAILWLLALAVWKVGDLVNLWAIGSRPLETLVSLGLGVGAVEALQWDLFAAWGQDVTVAWLAIVATGLIVGGAATVLRTASRLTDALVHRVDNEVVTADFGAGARPAA